VSEGSRAVVVTGMGSVSAIGNDCEELLGALERGESGIRPVARFDTSGFTTRFGAEARECGDGAGVDSSDDLERCIGFAVRAAQEALRAAGLRTTGGGVTSERFAVVLGTGLGEVDRPIHTLTVDLAARLGIGGPRLTICTACSSSTAAIGCARDLLESDCIDVALAGGADALTDRIFAGFDALGVLSPGRCAPFSTPFGTTLGEGAGFLVMERSEHARARGAEALAVISGYGLSGDAHHETSPDPTGSGVGRALLGALDDAGLGREDIGYVNAHGSGTEANDASEWRGIQRGLGEATVVPVSSSKGALGHAQGAAGVLETIVTILMMRRRLLPQTQNFSGSRTFGPTDPVAGPLPRPGSYEHALCLNSAFGGSNAALVVSRPSVIRPRRPAQAPVSVAGVGLVSSRGLGWAAWQRGGAAAAGRVPPFAMDEVSNRIDPHGLDASSRFLTAAGALALADAGIRMKSRQRSGAGLVVGSTRPSPESLERFGKSIDEHGLEGISVPAFARVVINAPAGFCSKLLGLKGPLTVLTTGAGSGLTAIILAAELLSSREGVELMLAGGVDELTDHDDGVAAAGEGAGIVALTRGDSGGAAAPRIVSWGVAGPGRSVSAVRQALSRAGSGPLPREQTFDEARFAGPGAREWALPSVLAFLVATAELRSGRMRRALVTSALGSAVSAAVLLEA